MLIQSTPKALEQVGVEREMACSGVGKRSGKRNSSTLQRGEIGKGCDCNTCRGNSHLKRVCKVPSHELLQTNYCTRNSRKNAIAVRPLQTIASHELLRELLRQQTTISATPLAESTPPPDSQQMSWLVVFIGFPPFFRGGLFQEKSPVNQKEGGVRRGGRGGRRERGYPPKYHKTPASMKNRQDMLTRNCVDD